MSVLIPVTTQDTKNGYFANKINTHIVDEYNNTAIAI